MLLYCIWVHTKRGLDVTASWFLTTKPAHCEAEKGWWTLGHLHPNTGKLSSHWLSSISDGFLKIGVTNVRN